MAGNEVMRTPTPWLLDGGCIYVLDDSGRTNRFSASVQGGFVYMSNGRDSKSQRTPQSELDANAAFIVRAVNAHDDLVEALKLAEDVLSRAPFSTQMWPTGIHPQIGITTIRAALRKALSPSVPEA